MSDSVTINKQTYTVPNTGNLLWGDYTTNTLKALAANSGTDLSKTIFVNKNGLDTNDGKTPAKSKLTIPAAVTAAEAISGADNENIATVFVLDGFEYDQAVTITKCHLFAPLATYAQANPIIFNFNSSLRLCAHINRIQTGGVQKLGTGTLNLHCNTLQAGINLDAGILNAWIGELVNGYNVAAGSTLNMFVCTKSGTEVNAGTANITAAGNAQTQYQITAPNGTNWYLKVDNDGVPYTEDS